MGNEENVNKCFNIAMTKRAKKQDGQMT